MLANGPCAQFIGNSPDYPISNAEAPLDVLNKLAADPAKLRNRYDFVRRDGDKVVIAAADGDGAAGRMEVYWHFFHLNPEGPNVQASYNTFAGDMAYRLTVVQWRALVLLHELAHIQGTLAADHGGDEVGFEQAVIENCIPNAVREPAIVIRPGPPDPIEIAPIDGIGTVVPPIFVPPSDPGDSEYPELGDCCEEVPDPGDSEYPELGDCCEEVPGDWYEDEGDVPFDPGYGGGDYVDPDWGDWGGGGWGGEDDPFPIAEEEYAY
jgi:hypothetical protein